MDLALESDRCPVAAGGGFWSQMEKLAMKVKLGDPRNGGQLV
jgi:hypothetical protein